VAAPAPAPASVAAAAPAPKPTCTLTPTRPRRGLIASIPGFCEKAKPSEEGTCTYVAEAEKTPAATCAGTPGAAVEKKAACKAVSNPTETTCTTGNSCIFTPAVVLVGEQAEHKCVSRIGDAPCTDGMPIDSTPVRATNTASRGLAQALFHSLLLSHSLSQNLVM
jgi:hypothetical protein